MSADQAHWFADLSDPEDAVEGAPWQPFIQTESCCFPLPVWFKTRGECEDWIAGALIGAELRRDQA